MSRRRRHRIWPGLLLLLLLAACGGPRTWRLPRGAEGASGVTFASRGDAFLIPYTYPTVQGQGRGECREWPSGHRRWHVEGLAEAPWNTAFSPDGSEVALYDGEGNLRFYDAQVVYLAYSPDKRFLAATTFRTHALRLYALSGEGQTRTLCQGEDCCTGCLTFAPQGEALLAMCGSRIVRWEVER